MARRGSGVADARLPRNVPLRRRAIVAALGVLLVVLADLVGGVRATPAGAQEVKPPLTVDGAGPCRRIGGDWLQPGYCELTGPLRVGPDDSLVLAVSAFLLGPVEVEGRLEVRGAASLVFFFGELANQGLLAVTGGGVAYVAGAAESPGTVEVSEGGRMEILSDSGALSITGRFDVAADGRLDVYGAFDNQGGGTTNLGVMAVWCGGSLVGPLPLGVAAQVQDCRPPEVSLVSRTPADGSGWNRGTVTVVWACTDEGSGVVTERVTAVLSGDGAEQQAFGVCTDLAGNTAAGVVTGINIERPAPKTRRRPAPPVVVHLEPSAPAPPPPPAPAPLPAAAPDGPLPGPSLADPVSSPDPAPAPVDPTAATVAPSTTSTAATSTAATSTTATSTTASSAVTTVTSAPSSAVVSSAPLPVTTLAAGSTTTALSTTSSGAAATTTSSGAAATTSTARAAASAPSPTSSPSSPPPVTDQAPAPTTVGTAPTAAGSGPPAGPAKTLRHRPSRHLRRTGGSAPPG